MSISVQPVKISVDDLRPGDVLLSRAPSNVAGFMGLLDQMILKLDEGDYTHSALYVGMYDGQHRVVESISEGVMFHSINVDLDAQELVHAYRFQGELNADAVVTQALNLTGGKYAWTELMSLALLAATVETFEAGEEQIEEIDKIGVILTAVDDAFFKTHGKRAMTCAQAVVTAFYAGGYPIQPNMTLARTNPFKLPPPDHRSHIQNILLTLAHNIDKALLAVLKNVSVAELREQFDVPPPVFTPRDLSVSPSLKLIGALPVAHDQLS